MAFVKRVKGTGKKSPAGRWQLFRNFFTGGTLVKGSVDGKHYSVRKKPFGLSILFGHDIKVDGRAHSSFYIIDEGEAIRLILANHKRHKLHLIPKIAEDIARKLGKTKVYVEASGEDIHNHMVKNGFVIHTNKALKAIREEPDQMNVFLANNIYFKDLTDLGNVKKKLNT